jgi:hypothetical protein
VALISEMLYNNTTMDIAGKDNDAGVCTEMSASSNYSSDFAAASGCLPSETRTTQKIPDDPLMIH